MASVLFLSYLNLYFAHENCVSENCFAVNRLLLMSEIVLLMQSVFYILYSEWFKSNTLLTLDMMAVINLWWLILCDSMSGPQDAQIAGRTLFLGVSVRVFVEEFSTGISGLSKVDFPPKCGCTASNLLRAWTEQKSGGRLCSLHDCLLQLGL